jgi:hypothetical protein
MNRICSIGRFACFPAELAPAVRSPLTKAASSRFRRVALVAAMAGLVGPLTAAWPATAAQAAGTAPPDMVTQWNLTMIAGLEAAAIPPPPSARIGAIVQASVFDAVNGITRRYAFYHVAPAAPAGASRAAAVAGAAYTTLVNLIPAQKPLFDATSDPAWTPLLPTPAFQEYPCAHSGASSAAASVLASFYGDATSFTVTSAGLPGVQRDFTSFSAAVQQVEDARIYAGFHFRFSCADAAALGANVAQYVTGTLMQPLRQSR